jgi:hypothetical protein
MRSTFITSALTIAFAVSGSIVPAVGESIVMPTATQQQMSEIDRATLLLFSGDRDLCYNINQASQSVVTAFFVPCSSLHDSSASKYFPVQADEINSLIQSK